MDGFKLDELYWDFLILVMWLLNRYFYQVLSCLGLLLSSTIAYFQLNHRIENKEIYEDRNETEDDDDISKYRFLPPHSTKYI